MARAGLLVIVLLMISAPCQSKAKNSLPVKMPKFVEADNGMPAAAALRAGGYLTRVILHFAGMDPPVSWEPFPKTAETIPAWMDAVMVMPAAVTAVGAPACGKSDLGQLALRLQDEAPEAGAASAPPAPGLIHLDGPAAPSASLRGPGAEFDSRAIYGHASGDCLVSASD